MCDIAAAAGFCHTCHIENNLRMAQAHHHHRTERSNVARATAEASVSQHSTSQQHRALQFPNQITFQNASAATVSMSVRFACPVIVGRNCVRIAHRLHRTPTSYHQLQTTTTASKYHVHKRERFAATGTSSTQYSSKINKLTTAINIKSRLPMWAASVGLSYTYHTHIYVQRI